MNIIIFLTALQFCLIDCPHEQSSSILDKHNEQDSYDGLNKVFLDISRNTVPPGTIEKLDDYANKLNAHEKALFINQIGAILRIMISLELGKGDADLLNGLDGYLKNINVDDGIIYYLLYNIYERLYSGSCDDLYFKKSKEYLKRSAEAGLNQAVLDWSEYILRYHGKSVADAKECFGLLNSMRGDESKEKVSLLRCLFVINHPHVKFTDLSLEDALQYIFSHQDDIVSSVHRDEKSSFETIEPLYLNSLLKASIIYLSEKQQNKKALALLGKFIHECESMDVLFRLIYASDTIAPELKPVSSLCLHRIEELIGNQDKQRIGSLYLSEQGLANKENLDELNKDPSLMPSKFIELCLSHLRLKLEKKQVNLVDLFDEVVK